MNPHQWLIYFITLAGINNFCSLLSAFAMIKDDIEEEFSISEGFLGIIDGLSFLGRAFGSIFILMFPSKTPKRDFTISCIIAIAFLAFIPLIKYMTVYCRPVILISMLGSGFCRSYIMVPILILTQNIDPQKEKSKINIWSSLMYITEPSTVILSYFLRDYLKANWELCFSFFLLVFLVTSILFYTILPQVNMNRSESEEESQQVSGLSQCYECLSKFFQKRSNLLWMFDSVFQQTLIYNFIMWFPYYFSKMDFHFSLTLISVSYHLMIFPGSVLFEFFTGQFPSKVNQMMFGSLCVAFMLTVFLIFIEPVEENAATYILVACFIGLTQAGGLSHTFGTEMVERTSESMKEKFYVVFFNRLVYTLFVFLFMIAIGFLMELSLHSFFYVIAFNAGLLVILQGVRKFILPEDALHYNTMQEQLFETNDLERSKQFQIRKS